jgi:hypothetical protein
MTDKIDNVEWLKEAAKFAQDCGSVETAKKYGVIAKELTALRSLVDEAINKGRWPGSFEWMQRAKEVRRG